MKLSQLFYGAIIFLSFVLPLQAQGSVAWHIGEVSGINVSIKYYGYTELDPDGLPVYNIGGMIKYIATQTNTSQRQYKWTEVRGRIRYAEDVSGIRWWFDNKFVEFKAGDPLPGGLSDWVPVEMGPGAVVKFQQELFLAYEALPGKIYVELEMRHVNQGNNDDAAVFILFPNVKSKVIEPY